MRQKDGGRPDLEARGDDGKPLIKVEAKLGAAFADGQLSSYIDDLHARSGGGLLLLLVPGSRALEAAEAVSNGFAVDGEGPWRLPGRSDCSVAVISWEDVLDALRAVPSESFHPDFQQFEAMYRVLKGHDIEPPASEEELQAWRAREEAFVNLVDRATRRLSQCGKVLPMGREQDSVSYRRRYVSRPLGTVEHCFSVGVRDSFAGYSTPVWLRFNRYYAPLFTVIRDRLLTSSLSERVVESGGDVWVALAVPLHVDGDGIVESLVEQAADVVRIAYQPLPAET